MKLMIVGDCFGKEDEIQGAPFMGAPGYMLTQLLAMNGIRREECYLTNVFMQRPDGNDIALFCGPRATAIPGLPPLLPGKFVTPTFAHELARLSAEVALHQPNLILALGATAAWFFLHDRRVSKIRGAAVTSRLGPKVIVSYHPSAVLKDYTLRPILIADIEKAAREMEYRDLRRPQRYIHIEPNYQDITNFYHDYIIPAEALSIDVETIGPQITCIGLSPSPDRAMVIPFYDPTKPGGNYWATPAEEVRVWRFLSQILRQPRSAIGQNFTYDAKFFWRGYGIPVLGMAAGDDTMLLHHALQPELQKGLAFLGTIYTDEAPWKLERKSATIKRED